MAWEIRQGNALERLREMPDESVQCCVTSPPYWGLRDYGTEPIEWPAVSYALPGGTVEIPPMTCSFGLEETPEQFVGHAVLIFAEVRRVLRADGTLWLNMGDSYAGRADGSRSATGHRDRKVVMAPRTAGLSGDLKAKDLVGIPWLLAFAARAEGWWLRSEVIWDKRNGLPGGGKVVSKPDRFHEHVFLLAKSSRYFYDADAIREESDPQQEEHNERYAREYEANTEGAPNRQPGNVNHVGIHSRPGKAGRNKRSVWRISTFAFPGAHFAVFPPALVEPCVLAGSKPGDTILDPFCGAATTGMVSARLERNFVGIELNPEYVQLGRDRIRDDAPLLNMPTEVAA